MIKNLNELLKEVKSLKRMKLAVAAAEDFEVLQAVFEAEKIGIIEPILIGDIEKIKKISDDLKKDLSNIKLISAIDIVESAKIATKLVSENQADFLMKGLLDTSVLLKEVLNKEYGLRTDSLLSHLMVYEIPTYHKLLFLTDGGMNIAPSLEDKIKILKNAIKGIKPFDIEKINIACLAAKEKVNPKMIATLDAKALSEYRFEENVIVEGPLAFDLAISKEASIIKGFKSEISGNVDMILVPTIEVGNAIGKTLTYMANAKSAGIILGAKAPVVLVSRADSHESKLYSIALGAIISTQNK